MLEDLYADDDEEEEASLGQKVKGFFLGVPNMILQRVQKEKDNYFPPQDLEEDLVYDPGENLPAPTVLLSHDMGQCYGRLVYEGSRGEKDYILDKAEYHIGSRDERNEVLLHSATVSRHHARIWREGDDYYVEDLNSTNGTFVNGEIVNINEPRKLCYMDQIAFADVEYRMV